MAKDNKTKKQNISETGRPRQIIEEVKRANGKRINVHDKIKQLKTNLTSEQKEHAQTKSMLIKNQATLLMAQEIAHLGTWVWDVVADKTTYSDECYRILGCEPGQMELTNEYVLNAIHPDDVTKEQEAVRTIMAAPWNIYEYEIRYIRPDGAIRFVQARGKAVDWDSNNRPTLVVGTARDITESKQAEDALRNSNEMLSRAQKIAHVGSWDWDFISGELTWSDEMFRIAGLPPQQVTWELSQAAVHPDDRDIVQAMHEAVFSGEGFINGHFRIVRPDGEIRHVCNEGEIILDGNGTPVRTFGVMQDITDRKQAENDSRQAREFIDNAINAQIDTFFVFDPKTGKAIRWNENFSKISGYTDEEISAMKAPDSYYDREDLKEANESLKELAETGIATVEISLITKKGKKIPFEYKISLIETADGQDIAISIGRDITERRQAEEALRVSEEKFSRTFHNSPILTSVTRAADGKFIDVNEAFVTTTGYSHQEIIGHTSVELGFFSPQSREKMKAIFLKQGFVKNEEFCVRSKGGKEITILFSTSGVEVSGEQCLVSIAQDITERKKAEEALQASENKYRNFIANSTDGIYRVDFKNPVPIDLPHDELASRIEQDAIVGEINVALADMYGMKSEEMIGRPLTDFAPDYGLRGAMLLGNEGYQYAAMETIDYDKDGNKVYLSESGIGEIEDGHLIHIRGVQRNITDRKDAEEKLKESEEKFRLLSESSPMGVFYTDKEGKVLYTNPAWQKITGFSLDESLDFKWADALYHEDKSWVLAEWADCLKKVKGYKGEFRFIDKKGKIKWVYTATSPIKTRDGRIVGHVGSNQDITQRKQAERKLQESESKFRSITENAVDFIFIKDMARRYIFVNQAMQELFGLPEEAILGKTPEDILGSEQGGIVREVDDRTFSGETVNETRSLVIGDKEFFFNTIQTPLTRAGGEVTSIMAIVRDITDRKRAEDLLREKEQNYREIFNATSNGIFIHDAETSIILDVNETVLKMFGYSSRDEILNLDVDDLSSGEHPYTKQEGERYLKKAVEEGIQSLEWQSKRKDGKLFWSEVVLSSTQIGGAGRVLAVVQDITDRKRAEKEAREHQAQLAHISRLNIAEGLSSSLAHELNHPLFVMQAQAERSSALLKSGSQNIDTVIDKMQIIIEQAERAEKIISRIRGLVRKGISGKKKVLLNELIEGSLELLGSEIKQNKIALHLDLSTDALEVNVDPVQIEQVIINLIKNSMDALNDIPGNERQILVKSLVAKGNAEVRITDNGPGMTPKEMQVAFDSFYTTKSNGLGIGLSISRSIIESHGGSIGFETNADKGVTSYFRLPLNNTDQ